MMGSFSRGDGDGEQNFSETGAGTRAGIPAPIPEIPGIFKALCLFSLHSCICVFASASSLLAALHPIAPPSLRYSRLLESIVADAETATGCPSSSPLPSSHQLDFRDGEWGPTGNTGNAGNGDGANYLPVAGIGAGTGTKSEGGDGEQGGIPRPRPAPLTSLMPSTITEPAHRNVTYSPLLTSIKEK
ncbi:uncharacterized protein DS421_7g207380 [Arachis hypogaea]|nr:uncharacterized protein DS421_7g207380 [Arachis hypogaea]